MIDFLLGVPGKLKTIYDYLVANLSTTRTAKIDNLDAAISTRAAASTALTNATWTDAKAGFIDGAISGRLGSIKAIYTGNITIANGASSGTATITAVNTAKAIYFGRGFNPTGFSGALDISQVPIVTLTNSTTVTATRGGTTQAMSVAYTVVEFN